MQTSNERQVILSLEQLDQDARFNEETQTSFLAIKNGFQNTQTQRSSRAASNKMDSYFRGMDPVALLEEFFKVRELVPGLVNELKRANDYPEWVLILDNSGSMRSGSGNYSGRYGKDLSPQMQVRFKSNEELTRWEDLEERLHLMVPLFAFFPKIRLNIFFLNGESTINLDQSRQLGYTGFIHAAHQAISNFFEWNRPDGFTPLVRHTKKVLKDCSEAKRKLILIFTDGQADVPGDASETDEELYRVISMRKNPINSPITFINCCPQELNIISKLDNLQNSYVASLSRYKEEQKQVQESCGTKFPFNKHIWILAHLVGAISPVLDKLDEENQIILIEEMSNYFGYDLTEEEYKIAYLDYKTRNSQHRYNASQNRHSMYASSSVASQEQGAFSSAHNSSVQANRRCPLPDISDNDFKILVLLGVGAVLLAMLYMMASSKSSTSENYHSNERGGNRPW